MEIDESLNILLSKPEPNKNEELSKFVNIINNFNVNQNPVNKIYIDIFNNIIEKRLKMISDIDANIMYLWKAMQALRILSRNIGIQKEMYKESHISIFKLCLEKLVKAMGKTKHKVVESTLIELISIIKRFFLPNPNISKQTHEKYLNMIVESDIIDNFILIFSS